MIDSTNINARLKALFSYDVRFILKDNDLRNEYIELHSIIEEKAPACTGCTAKKKLREWKKKYSKKEVVINKKKKEMVNNTFKLKKGVTSLRIPFSRKVITSNSSDEVVLFYINSAKTEADKERRLAFFEILPQVKEVVTDVVEKPKNKRKRRTKAQIQADKEAEENRILEKLIKQKQD